jgi:integrase
MALKGQLTKSDYLDWNEMILLLQKLERDKQYKFQLLIAVGCFTGLRISDLLKLKWIDVINKDSLEIIETKTKKVRKIKLNENLTEIIARLHPLMNIKDEQELLFINKNRTKAINIQYINRRLKEIAIKYNLNISNFSTHTFRKTLGRRAWKVNNYSEKSLVLLSDLFNHSSVAITKIYLGIKEDEIADVYSSLSL